MPDLSTFTLRAGEVALMALPARISNARVRAQAFTAQGVVGLCGIGSNTLPLTRIDLSLRLDLTIILTSCSLVSYPWVTHPKAWSRLHIARGATKAFRLATFWVRFARGSVTLNCAFCPTFALPLVCPILRLSSERSPFPCRPIRWRAITPALSATARLPS